MRRVTDYQIPLVFIVVGVAALVVVCVLGWLYPCVEYRTATCTRYCHVSDGKDVNVTFPCGEYECDQCVQRRYRYAPDPNVVEKP